MLSSGCSIQWVALCAARTYASKICSRIRCFHSLDSLESTQFETGGPAFLWMVVLEDLLAQHGFEKDWLLTVLQRCLCFTTYGKTMRCVKHAARILMLWPKMEIWPKLHHANVSEPHHWTNLNQFQVNVCLTYEGFHAFLLDPIPS